MNEDAKRIADKYIARDGSPVLTIQAGVSPVPKIRPRRDGYFWCQYCGLEEKIHESHPPDYIPLTCIACSAHVLNKGPSKAAIVGMVDQLTGQLKQMYEQRKIDTNEGNFPPEKLEELRKHLENIEELTDRIRLKAEK